MQKNRAKGKRHGHELAKTRIRVGRHRDRWHPNAAGRPGDPGMDAGTVVAVRETVSTSRRSGSDEV